MGRVLADGRLLCPYRGTSQGLARHARAKRGSSHDGHRQGSAIHPWTPLSPGCELRVFLYAVACVPGNRFPSNAERDLAIKSFGALGVQPDGIFVARVYVEGGPPDGDGDLILPGAITDGHAVRVSLAEHDTMPPPTQRFYRIIVP